MDLTEYYGIVVGSAVCLLLLCLVPPLVGMCYKPVRRRLKHLCNPLLPSWVSGRVIISTREAVLLCALLAVNGVCVGVKVRDGVAEITRRLGHVAPINLVLLSCGAHMNHIVRLCGVRPEQHIRFHAWLGGIVIVEATLHTILGHAEISHLAGLLMIAASSLLLLQSWAFELFTNLHTVLATATLTALWLHLPSSPFHERPRLYLLLGSILFVLTKLVRLLNILYRSMSSRGKNAAHIERHGDGVEISIRMARPLKFKAGQYIYLSLWGLSGLSALESHPFQICLDHADDNAQQVIVLLVQPRQGFTRRLLASTSARDYAALIEGPYGQPLSLDQYGTVLLFATGIGIAGQLPYVRELLDLYLQCRVKTRRIALFWEVRKWIDELLALDVDYILDIHVYIRGHFLSRGVAEGDVEKPGTHGRITNTYAKMRPDVLIASEMETRKGKTVVSLCTNPTTSRVVMEVLEDAAHGDVDVKRLDFQPWTPKDEKDWV
ncbi:hypothetical protein GGR52DRAFT_585349 [Hypoxylon sp. FL1284]|nr:hypothetical protein GGR52DRAFT_585349 [Hypoxylon sp. FL1284]